MAKFANLIKWLFCNTFFCIIKNVIEKNLFEEKTEKFLYFLLVVQLMTKLPRQEKKQNLEELNKCFMRISLKGRFNSASLQIDRSTFLFLVSFTLLRNG
jgi:hypothetical protein